MQGGESPGVSAAPPGALGGATSPLSYGNDDTSQTSIRLASGSLAASLSKRGRGRTQVRNGR